MGYILVPIVIGLIVGTIAAIADEEIASFFLGFILAGMAAGVFSAFILASNVHAENTRERKEICTQKGGVVEKDSNLCMVNGKPVEYSPGKWKYDG